MQNVFSEPLLLILQISPRTQCLQYGTKHSASAPSAPSAGLLWSLVDLVAASLLRIRLGAARARRQTFSQMAPALGWPLH